MPLYEYECQACGHHLEVQQRMSDAALTTCPKCGKDELQKLISATAFHLKGGGWYKDLYASSKPGESTGASSSSTSSSTPSDTAAKPATTEKSTTPAPAPAAPAAGKSGSGSE